MLQESAIFLVTYGKARIIHCMLNVVFSIAYSNTRNVFVLVFLFEHFANQFTPYDDI